MKNIVHHSLESSWTISHTKKHYQQPKNSTVCVKYGLPFISGLNLDIVEILAHIQFGKVHCFLKLQSKPRDQGEWVLVLDGHCIEVSIIIHQLERTVLFLDEKHWCNYKRFGGIYLSSAEIFRKEGIKLQLLFRG